MRTSAPTPAPRLKGWEPFSHHAGAGVGVLLCHGFTSGPASMMPLARRLAEAGLDVEVPCLSGHGTRWQDLVPLTAEDWLGDLQAPLELLQARCAAVFVMGLSMGGTLALRLAQLDPGIRGVVAINHALVFGNPLVPLAFLLKHWVPSTPAIGSDLMDPGQREPAYDRTPTAGVAQVQRLARAVRRDLARLQQPLLILKSRQDHVLPARNGPITLREAGSLDKQLIWLEQSFHVATLDYDQERIAELCLAFVRRLAPVGS